jgi:hypothetical protein
MKPSQVLAPVVELRQGAQPAAAICTLWSEPAGGAIALKNIPADKVADLRLAPVAAPLLEANLFDSGCIAAMAVRRLGVPPPALALWQRLRGSIGQQTKSSWSWVEGRRLYAAGAIPDRAESSELALALALMLPAAGFRGVVMATGSLSEPQYPAEQQHHGPGVRVSQQLEQPAGQQEQPERRNLPDTDTLVHPVDGLPEKLAKLAEEARMRSLGNRDRPGGICFTPLEAAPGQAVETLPEARDLQDAGVRLLPVRSLQQAATHLECKTWRLLPGDWIIWALLVGLLVTGAFWAWRAWPIPLAFERGGGAAGYTEPFIACLSQDQRYTRPEPIGRRDGIARIAAGQKLAWIIQVGKPDAWDAPLLQFLDPSGYYLLFAMVYADGSIELQDHTPAGRQRPGNPPFRAAAGMSWSQWIQIPTEAAAGEANLVILARRDRPFDTRSLRQGLDALRLDERNDRVNPAVNYLQAQAPGFLDFQLERSDHVPDPCRP